MSPSGKAAGFGPVIRRFDPCHPSQENKMESLLSYFVFLRMAKGDFPAIPAIFLFADVTVGLVASTGILSSVLNNTVEITEASLSGDGLAIFCS